jgi:hypothetical protein
VTHERSAQDPAEPQTNLIAPAPVFVDAEGRRARLLRRLAYAFGALVLVYGGLISVSLAGGPVRSSAVLPLPLLEDPPSPGQADFLKEIETERKSLYKGIAGSRIIEPVEARKPCEMNLTVCARRAEKCSVTDSSPPPAPIAPAGGALRPATRFRIEIGPRRPDVRARRTAT